MKLLLDLVIIIFEWNINKLFKSNSSLEFQIPFLINDN